MTTKKIVTGNYKIMGKSRYGTEELDEAKTEKEANYLLGEYALAYGPGWEIWIEEPETYTRLY